MAQNIPLKGPGGVNPNNQEGISGLVQNIKDTNLQKVATQGAQLGINSLPISQENKDALNKLSEKVVQKIIPAEKTIGTLVQKPQTTSLASKPESEGVAYKIRPRTLSGWDRFKNGLSKFGQKAGLTTHIINDDDNMTDYDYTLRKDKQGNVMVDKQGYALEDKKWNWQKARENDAKLKRATTTQFDPTALIGMAGKVATKFI